MASLLAGAAPMSNDAGDPPSRTVWVAPTLVDGDVAPKAPEAFSSAFREGLERGGVGLRVSGSAAECAGDSACQADAARAVSADYAIWLSVRVDRRDYAIDVRVLEGGSGAVVAEASETCEVCGLAEAVAVVDSVAGAVVGRLDARDLEPPVLRFSSDPRAAVVRLDGAVVGETPFERPVAPGVHTVSAEKSGFVTEERRVDAVPGVVVPVAFTLEPVPVVVDRSRIESQRRWGLAATGVGATALATGVVLLVMDGRPNRTQCSGGQRDQDGDCKFLYSTAVPGIVVGVAGVGLLATGVALLVRAKRTRRGYEMRSSAQALRRRVRLPWSPPMRRVGGR